MMDGQTDTGRQQRPRLRIASRGKNDSYTTRITLSRVNASANAADVEEVLQLSEHQVAHEYGATPT